MGKNRNFITAINCINIHLIIKKMVLKVFARSAKQIHKIHTLKIDLARRLTHDLLNNESPLDTTLTAYSFSLIH